MLSKSKRVKDKLSPEEIDLLSSFTSGSWKLTNEGKINVKGSVWMNNHGLTSIPFDFGIVTDSFTCAYNKITSLKGCPINVNDFSCIDNKITNLEHVPIIGKTINCYDNPFILNDKLFEDIKEIGEKKFSGKYVLFEQLKMQIYTQFGVTDEIIVNDIWNSYTKILEK